MNIKLSHFVVLVMVSGLTACASWLPVNFGDNEIILTEATDRVIYRQKAPTLAKDGSIKAATITCAEPSPDVAKATELAFQAAIEVAKQGNINAGYSSATAIAQLVERTASIQLLRDQMFRACEAFANGAITPTSYSLLMSRINKSMVTLMIAEVSAGAYGRSGVTITGGGDSKGSQQSQGFVENFEDALSKIDDAQSKIDDAKAKLNTAKTVLTAYEDMVKADVSKTDAEQEKTLKKAVSDAESEVTSAEKSKKDVAELLRGGIHQSLELKTETEASALGGITANQNALIAGMLTDMQEGFIQQSVADEYISSCIVELGRLPSKVVKTTKEGSVVTETVIENKSKLTEHCELFLKNALDHAESNRQSNLKRRLLVDVVTEQTNLLRHCSDLPLVQRSACYKWARLDLPATNSSLNLTDFKKLSAFNKSQEEAQNIKAELAGLLVKLTAISDKNLTKDERSERKKLVADAGQKASLYKDISDGKFDPIIPDQPLSTLVNDIISFSQSINLWLVSKGNTSAGKIKKTADYVAYMNRLDVAISKYGAFTVGAELLKVRVKEFIHEH